MASAKGAGSIRLPHLDRQVRGNDVAAREQRKRPRGMFTCNQGPGACDRWLRSSELEAETGLSVTALTRNADHEMYSRKCDNRICSRVYFKGLVDAIKLLIWLIKRSKVLLDVPTSFSR